MKTLQIKFFIYLAFLLFSIFLTVVIGYIDEGNSKNYDSFFSYILTDAFSDNVNDLGRHGWTILFFISICLTFFLTKFIPAIKDQPITRLAVALPTWPVTLCLLILLLGGTIMFFTKMGWR